MHQVYKKLEECDGIIFGTPVYFAQMTGQMKLCIDRMYALIDAEYSSRLPPGKKAAVIITQGDENPGAFTSVAGTFSFAMSFLSIPVMDPVIVPGLDLPTDAANNASAMEKAYQLGKSLVSTV
jgi:multimeric flavodoxin WrbA